MLEEIVRINENLNLTFLQYNIIDLKYYLLFRVNIFLSYSFNAINQFSCRYTLNIGPAITLNIIKLKNG